MFNGMPAVQDNELAENAIMERPGLSDGHRRRLESHSWPSEPVRIWAFPQVEALDSFSPDPSQEEGSITTHECVIDAIKLADKDRK